MAMYGRVLLLNSSGSEVYMHLSTKSGWDGETSYPGDTKLTGRYKIGNHSADPRKKPRRRIRFTEGGKAGPTILEEKAKFVPFVDETGLIYVAGYATFDNPLSGKPKVAEIPLDDLLEKIKDIIGVSSVDEIEEYEEEE